MIFNNNKSYVIKNNTRNNTNTKQYVSLNKDYVFESTFRYLPKNDGTSIESCVLGRTGYNFGIYVYESDYIKQTQKQFNKINNTIKWVWFREENGETVYDDLFFGFNEDDIGYLNHLNWWRQYITKESPAIISSDLIDGLSKRWGFFDGTLKLNSIKDTKLLEWVLTIENKRNNTGSYITGTIKVSVKKIGEWFELYVNDIFYKKKLIGNIINNDDKTICIGVGDPYRLNNDAMCFSGEIKEIKIYDSSIQQNDSLYSWIDFNKHTHFKVFDKSLNGNHAELYESEEFKNNKNIEFNQFSYPAKIL